MKRILTILVCLAMMINLIGCGSQQINENRNFITSKEDIQGFWFMKDASMVMGFKGDNYIIYGFGTGISITGNYDVTSQTITLHSDDYSDKIFTEVYIDDNDLSLKTQSGDIQKWESISEDEVRSMLK